MAFLELLIALAALFSMPTSYGFSSSTLGLRLQPIFSLRKTNFDLKLGNLKNGSVFCSKCSRKLQMGIGYTTETESNPIFNISGHSAKRIASWLGFAGLCWLFQWFSPIIVGTFLLSIIGNTVVDTISSTWTTLVGRLKISVKNKPPRKIFAAAYFIILGLTIARFALFLTPRILKETTYVMNVLQSEDPYALTANAIQSTFGSGFVARLEGFILAAIGEAGRLSLGLRYDGLVDHTRRLGKLLQYCSIGYLQSFLSFSSKVISNSSKIAYKGLLSLIFSFMIVWDLPKISEGMKKLETSRIGFAYSEVAPRVAAFANLVGKTFEVQAFLALVNCVLTTLGLFALKISGLGFFSLLTFVSSFVPVAGIVVATVPPLVVALTEGGISKCFQLLAMVFVVHAVEAYFLYPYIYSVALKIHPFLTLVALVTAEHFAGIQGLFLALPVTLYLKNRVIFDGSDKSKAKADEVATV